MNLYRAMIVKTVVFHDKSAYLTFEDSCLSLIIRDPFFTKKKLAKLKAGQRIFIKGRRGNEDVVLASLDPI